MCLKECQIDPDKREKASETHGTVKLGMEEMADVRAGSRMFVTNIHMFGASQNGLVSVTCV